MGLTEDRRQEQRLVSKGSNHVVRLFQNTDQKDVLTDDARVRCIQRTVCVENRKLTRTFGAVGKILAKYLT